MRAFIGTSKIIRYPIKKTRQWATKKVSEKVHAWRQEAQKAGLGKYDAWMTFGETVVKRNLIPIFPENVTGLVKPGELMVNYSELSQHMRAAGKPLHVWAWDKNNVAAFGVWQNDDGSFGYISGLDSEVLMPALIFRMEELFSPASEMKGPSLEKEKRIKLGGGSGVAYIKDLNKRVVTCGDITEATRLIHRAFELFNALPEKTKDANYELRESLLRNYRDVRNELKQIPMRRTLGEGEEAEQQYKTPEGYVEGLIAELQKKGLDVGTDAYYDDPDHYQTVIVRGTADKMMHVGSIAKLYHAVLTSGVVKGSWEMNRYGHLKLEWDDGKELYIQDEDSVQHFLKSIGQDPEDVGSGDHDEIPDSVNWDYWEVADFPEKAQRRKTGGEYSLHMTEQQIAARKRVVDDKGTPAKEWYDNLMGVLFLQYGKLVIGIEKDGYAHS